MKQSTDIRIDRLELLVRALRADCAVHGVLFSRETDALFAEMAMGELRREVEKVEA